VEALLVRHPDCRSALTAVRGEQAIHKAAHGGHTQVVECLIRASGSSMRVINPCSQLRETPLFRGAAAGHLPVVELLVKVPFGHIRCSLLMTVQLVMNPSCGALMFSLCPCCSQGYGADPSIRGETPPRATCLQTSDHAIMS
jgi:ankyrin repeat protein